MLRLYTRQALKLTNHATAEMVTHLPNPRFDSTEIDTRDFGH